MGSRNRLQGLGELRDSRYGRENVANQFRDMGGWEMRSG